MVLNEDTINTGTDPYHTILHITHPYNYLLNSYLHQDSIQQYKSDCRDHWTYEQSSNTSVKITINKHLHE